MWLENEVRDELGLVLGDGRFLRGGQIPLGPAGQDRCWKQVSWRSVTPAQRPPLGHLALAPPLSRFISPLHSSSGICWYLFAPSPVA